MSKIRTVHYVIVVGTRKISIVRIPCI